MAEKNCLDHTPMRLFTAGMCFLVLFSMQSMRLNMSVAIVCMINHTALSEFPHSDHTTDNISSSEDHVFNEGKAIMMIEENNILSSNKTQDVQDNCKRDRGNETKEQREDGPFTWTKSQQGLILNAYFWGYVIFTIPSGWVANRFSSVRILTVSTALSSILCLMIPMAASRGYVGVIVLRALTGSLAGLFHPATQNLLAKWLPPSQLASIGSFAFSGATFGTILTFIFTGFMCKYGFAGGWPSVFYVNGFFCLAVAVCWLFLVREYPKSSSSNEKQHPCVGKVSKDNIKSKKVPWRSILTSKPVYAVFVCTAAIDAYGTVTTLYLPTYFADIMNFRIVSNGTLSSLPYVFKSLVQFSGGFISDLLKRKTSLSVGVLRKLIVGTGKIVCALSIIVIGFLTCDQKTLAVVLMITSLAATGFMEIGVGINLIDIAGSYAGLILAISCFISHTVGLAAASVTSAITSQNPTRQSWQLVFMMSAFIVVVALVFHICLASGLRQPWARNPDDDCDNIGNQIEVQVPLNEQNNVIGDSPDHKQRKEHEDLS